VGIVRQPTAGIRRRLADRLLAGSIEYHAWATRVHESPNTVDATPLDYVVRAHGIGSIIALPGTADSNDARNVKDHVDPTASSDHGPPVAKIATGRLHAQPIEIGVPSPAK
jgi:hypothetical protein